MAHPMLAGTMSAAAREAAIAAILAAESAAPASSALTAEPMAVVGLDAEPTAEPIADLTAEPAAAAPAPAPAAVPMLIEPAAEPVAAAVPAALRPVQKPAPPVFKPSSELPVATDLARRHKKAAEKKAKLYAKRAKYQAKCAEATEDDQKLREELYDTATRLYKDGHVDESVLALVYIVKGYANAIYKEDDGAISLFRHAPKRGTDPERMCHVIRMRDREYTSVSYGPRRDGWGWNTHTGPLIRPDGSLHEWNSSAQRKHRPVEHYVKYTDKTARVALSEAVDRVRAYKTRVLNAVATHLRTAEVPELIIAMAGGCPMSLWDRVPTKRRSGGDTTEEDE